MKVLRRKILLDDLKSFDDGLGYETITATSIYLKVEMIQTIDDLGLVTDLPFIPNGGQCAQFAGTIIITDVTCYDPNSPTPSNAYIKPTVYGGQPPFNFIFLNGSGGLIESVQTSNNTYTLYNQPAGDYTVEVVDNLGCVITLSGTSQTLSDAVSPVGYVILSESYNGIPAGEPIPFEDITETISVCETVDITLGVDDPQQYQDILWSTNETTDTIQITQSGNYSFQASNGTCFGQSDDISIEILGVELPSIQVDNLPIGVQGDGSFDYPYVICPPQSTTQEYLQFSVIGSENCNFFKWGVTNGSTFGVSTNPIYTLLAEECTIETPCGVSTTLGCDCISGLSESEIIWVAYENNLNCQPLSENTDPTG